MVFVAILLLATQFSFASQIVKATKDVGDYIFEPNLTGDVNDDGHVELLDVMMLVDYILTGESEGLVLEHADVNGDNDISIADITMVVNIVLGIDEGAPPVYAPKK